MIKKINPETLPDFDPAQHLETSEDMVAYLSIVMEEDDPALGDLARARGMAEVAKSAGVTREALYKALRPNTHLRFETISKACKSLGLRLHVEPAH